MSVREVNISEFLAAGEEGKALLDLVAKANISFQTDVVPTRCFNRATNETTMVNVSHVWFAPPSSINVIRDEGGGVLRESGVQGTSKENVSDALKNLFNSVTRGGATIEVTAPDQRRSYYKYNAKYNNLQRLL